MVLAGWPAVIYVQPVRSIKVSRRATKGDTELISRKLSRVFLQETATERYYDAHGLWILDEAQAFDFRTCSAAHEYAARLSLSNVQIVLQHEFQERLVFRLRTSLRA